MRDRRAQGSLSEFSEDTFFVNDRRGANGKNNASNINSMRIANGVDQPTRAMGSVEAGRDLGVLRSWCPGSS